MLCCPAFSLPFNGLLVLVLFQFPDKAPDNLDFLPVVAAGLVRQQAGGPAAFLLMAASPLDPLQTNVGQVALGSMSPEQVARLEDYWGTNTPLPERYLGWLADAGRGDFGTSLLYRRPVLEIIAERLGNSLGLLLFAWGLSGVLGLTLGVTAGALRGRWPDRLIRGWCLLISSTPAFWLALLLLMVFSVWLGWFPIGLSVPIGAAADSVTVLERLRHAVLPALTLSITGGDIWSSGA